MNLMNLIEKETIDKFNLETCKEIKKSTENEHAKYTLRKDTIPVTRWYLQDKEGNEINLDIGDGLDVIELEQCFDLQNNYLGTIRATVAELEPKNIKLSTPGKFFYLIGVGHKVFDFHKLQDEKVEVHQNTESFSFWKIVGIILLVLILISCGIVLL